jgi:hypothetical protein
LLAGVAPGKKLVGTAGIGILAVRGNPAAKSSGIFGIAYPDLPYQSLQLLTNIPNTTAIEKRRMTYGAALIVEVTAEYPLPLPLFRHAPLPYAFAPTSKYQHHPSFQRKEESKHFQSTLDPLSVQIAKSSTTIPVQGTVSGQMILTGAL